MAAPYQKNSLGWQVYKLQQRLEQWWERFTDRSFDPPGDAPDIDTAVWQFLAKTIFWSVLAVLAIWVLWALAKWLTPYAKSWLNPDSRLHDRGDRDREITVAEWLSRSRRYANGGNYRQACICLYLAMLQRLHDRGIAPHQPSRTDGEYLQIIQQLPQPQPYQTLLVAHQQLCFSNAPASLTLWQQCQQAYQELGNSDRAS
jgi:hypothetical protein